jgi:hypothetical protein
MAFGSSVWRRQLFERTSISSTDVIAHIFINAIAAQLGAPDFRANGMPRALDCVATPEPFPLARRRRSPGAIFSRS